MIAPVAPDIAWGWPEITVTLMWKLAPAGVVLTRRDLAALPMERVLMEERSPTQIEYSFISMKAAERRWKPKDAKQERAGASQLQGRWQKIAAVLLWKLAKDGVVLTRWDRDQVPADKVLLAHGHAQDIEYRFCPRAEAAAIAKWERDNEGKIILETVR